MFPLPWNFPFRKKDGTITDINDAIEGGGSQYELPTASASVKGGVKIGDGLTMEGDTLSADGGGFEPVTTLTNIGTYEDFPYTATKNGFVLLNFLGWSQSGYYLRVKLNDTLIFGGSESMSNHWITPVIPVKIGDTITLDGNPGMNKQFTAYFMG